MAMINYYHSHVGEFEERLTMLLTHKKKIIIVADIDIGVVEGKMP